MTSQSSSSSSSGSDSDGRATPERRRATKDKHSRSSEQIRSPSSTSSNSDDSSDNGVTLFQSILNGSAAQKQDSIDGESPSAAPDQARDFKTTNKRPRSAVGPKSAPSKPVENSIRVEIRQQVRPKSAKYKTRGLQGAAEKQRPFISSSSASSLSTFDDESTSRSERDFDQLTKQEQIEYRARQLRELLLHRYLDFRHQQRLNQHGKYFERHNRKSQASPAPSRPSGRRKYLEARAIYSRRPASKRRNTDLEDYEESIRRAARKLAEELIRAHRGRQLEEDDRIKSGKAMRPKSGRRKTRSEENGSSRSEDAGKVSQGGSKHVKVVAPCEEDEKSTERSSHRQEDEKASSSEHRSILKQDSTPANTPKKPPRPYTAVMVSSQKRRGHRSPKISSGAHDRTREPIYDDQFTYSYLMALLHTLRCEDTPSAATSQFEQSRGVPTRPKTAPNRPSTARPGRRLRKAVAKDGEEENREKKVRDEDKEKEEEEEDQSKGKDEREGKKERVKSAPQVRPGSHPIKCSWSPGKDKGSKKPEIKYSDHQLKNTDNPVIADWLKRKNALARRQKLCASRQHREKRERLMQEYNDKEDKREMALVEYERWKKKKNRDILLRRRKEIAVTNAQTEKPAVPDFKPGTGTGSSADQRDAKADVTSFSDLRSSAAADVATPTAAAKSLRPPGKPRPKSAPTKVSVSTPEATFARKALPGNQVNLVPVKFDFTNGEVEVVGHVTGNGSNLSAREPLMGNGITPAQNNIEDSTRKTTGTTVPKSMFDVPPPGTFKHDEVARENSSNGSSLGQRDQYNEWVRRKAKGKEPRSPTRKSFPSGRRSPGKSWGLPQHDPLTNELISDLAKRRIQKILDSKKEVDSGLGKNRPRATSPVSAQSKSLNSEEIRKWRLRDDVEEERPTSAAPRSRKSRRRDPDRPVFSYDRKTTSKSVFFERNPVVRQALNQS